MKLLAVINGGGRPGQAFLGFRDAIQPLGATSLCQVMNRHGSDKGSGWHTYTPFYDWILNPRRHGVRRVLEVGIGSPRTMSGEYRTGASLRAWRDYFPNAVICGADVDKQAVEEMVLQPRIHAYQCDQRSTHSVEWLWKRIVRDHTEQPFDLIVDDGDHTFESGITLLDRSWPMLGGYYVVEDIRLDLGVIDKWKAALAVMKNLRGVLFEMPDATTTENDNCLLVLERIA